MDGMRLRGIDSPIHTPPFATESLPQMRTLPFAIASRGTASPTPIPRGGIEGVQHPVVLAEGVGMVTWHSHPDSKDRFGGAR